MAIHLNSLLFSNRRLPYVLINHNIFFVNVLMSQHSVLLLPTARSVALPCFCQFFWRTSIKSHVNLCARLPHCVSSNTMVLWVILGTPYNTWPQCALIWQIPTQSMSWHLCHNKHLLLWLTFYYHSWGAINWPWTNCWAFYVLFCNWMFNVTHIVNCHALLSLNSVVQSREAMLLTKREGLIRVEYFNPLQSKLLL